MGSPDSCAMSRCFGPRKTPRFRLVNSTVDLFRRSFTVGTQHQLELRLLIEPLAHRDRVGAQRKIPFRDAPSAFLQRTSRSSKAPIGPSGAPRGRPGPFHVRGVSAPGSDGRRRFSVLPQQEEQPAASSQDGRGDPNRHHPGPFGRGGRGQHHRLLGLAGLEHFAAAGRRSRSSYPSTSLSWRARSGSGPWPTRSGLHLPSSSARSARRYRDRRIDRAGAGGGSWMCM